MDTGSSKGTRKHGKHSRRTAKADARRDLYYNEQQEKRRQAATVIQRTWRRWLDKGVFAYYKELIGFKQCGEPSQLMKYINPGEAEFLDAAAGVHIKFRLGGLKFPPSIYYKVFTHRPIVDLCACSPRDYTKLAVKKRQSGEIQKKSYEDYSSWYKRIENNGWRLLSFRFWKGLDSLTVVDNLRVRDSYYCKLHKKQEVERRRKKKKIQWLKKMYLGENLKVNTEDPNVSLLVKRAAEGLIGTLEKQETDTVMEWEIDEMIKWTNALNFEEYIKKWKEIGTSRTSDSFKDFYLPGQDRGPPKLSPLL
uniref:Chromosome 11 open reading frame 65 n=1 Tax=Salvator merianae TaxID=96440 RepID=A0A8D0BW26_SALMN